MRVQSGLFAHTTFIIAILVISCGFIYYHNHVYHFTSKSHRKVVEYLRIPLVT